MEKKRLFRIMTKADAGEIAALAKDLKERYAVVVVQPPERTLAMIRMREPVRERLFYLGEVMVGEAIVELDGAKGMAVSLSDTPDKILDMAIIDAACNRGVFTGEARLLALEAAQLDFERKENAMHRKTMVNFHPMDSEATT